MRLKSFVILLACTLFSAYYLTSCAPSLDQPSVPNELLASPTAISLKGATDVQQVDLRLRCGCTYAMDSMIALSGDTDKIVMVSVEKQTDIVSDHRVQFKAKQGTPNGSYQATFLFKYYSHSQLEFLPATVTVSLTLP